MPGTAPEEVIAALLATFNDACGPDGQGAGADAADDRILSMSALWRHGSYSTLLLCLLALREQDRPLYWHLASRYLRCRTRIGEGCPECGQPTRPGAAHFHTVCGKRLRIARAPIVVTVWDARVDPAKVEAGIAWLTAEHLRRFGPPFLPREIRASAAA